MVMGFVMWFWHCDLTIDMKGLKQLMLYWRQMHYAFSTIDVGIFLQGKSGPCSLVSFVAKCPLSFSERQSYQYNITWTRLEEIFRDVLSCSSYSEKKCLLCDLGFLFLVLHITKFLQPFSLGWQFSVSDLKLYTVWLCKPFLTPVSTCQFQKTPWAWATLSGLCNFIIIDQPHDQNKNKVFYLSLK